MNTSNTELLSVNQVASRIKVSASMVYSLVGRGLLKCHRIGRCIRFTEEQLTKYLVSCQAENELPKAQPRRRLRHLDT